MQFHFIMRCTTAIILCCMEKREREDYAQFQQITRTRWDQIGQVCDKSFLWIYIWAALSGMKWVFHIMQF